ncbi:hypothetical protein PVK06_040204 [Gossypium arboreum]|uniref:Uncharacterized protein n=1 Tax=Gossypium arboreum TaxID=29729 RepID=A0ABR0N4V8_GOSAR|nr:hypothetical protein PVK06_040204 [Gossypium arboreum]
MVSKNRVLLKKKMKIRMKVSKDSCGKFYLQYLPGERQFKLINEGKIVDDLNPQVLKSKQGKEFLAIESQQTDLNVVEKGTNDLVFKRSHNLDLANCHSLIFDEFILNSGMKSFSTSEYGIGKFVDEELGMVNIKVFTLATARKLPLAVNMA